MNRKDSYGVRSQILKKYYQSAYQKFLFSNDLQGLGIRYFERHLEKFWLKGYVPENVLEIGGGNGEHLRFVDYVPLKRYVSFDLRAPSKNLGLGELSDSLKSVVSFQTGNAEKLPFRDASFDRIKSTCLLHHVDDVLAVLMEARRVTSDGGELAFLIPTDPGMLNRAIKRFYSFPKLRKLMDVEPEILYALDHKNHVDSILKQIKFVFREDDLSFHYRPFYIRTWNFNLLIVAKIIKCAKN